MRGLRGRAGGLLGCILILLSAGCGSWAARPWHVRLNAGPTAAPFDTPVHIAVGGLPPAGLVTVQARTVDAEGRLPEPVSAER
jgi:hypothetical protein